MKQLQSKLWAKITALLLLTVFVIVLFFSGFGVLYLADQGGYSNPRGLCGGPHCRKRVLQQQ